MTVVVVPPSHPLAARGIDTTSRAMGWSRGLSPFFVGPVWSADGVQAQNVENLWQFSKVYRDHVGADGRPTQEWFAWRATGFADVRAHRYPMGKGRSPEFLWWDGQRLGYVEARRRVYVPVYARAVGRTDAYRYLEALYARERNLVLVDFDAYDHRRLRKTYRDVVQDPARKAGHGFVLAMMLEGELEEAIS